MTHGYTGGLLLKVCMKINLYIYKRTYSKLIDLVVDYCILFLFMYLCRPIDIWPLIAIHAENH